MIKNICHFLILALYNYITLNFIIDNINNNIKEVSYIYGLGIIFGFIAIISYYLLDRLFRRIEL